MIPCWARPSMEYVDRRDSAESRYRCSQLHATGVIIFEHTDGAVGKRHRKDPSAP